MVLTIENWAAKFEFLKIEIGGGRNFWPAFYVLVLIESCMINRWSLEIVLKLWALSDSKKLPSLKKRNRFALLF